GSDGQATHVIREVTCNLHCILVAAEPLVVSTIRRESGRLLEMMKRYVERGNVNCKKLSCFLQPQQAEPGGHVPSFLSHLQVIFTPCYPNHLLSFEETL